MPEHYNKIRYRLSRSTACKKQLRPVSGGRWKGVKLFLRNYEKSFLKKDIPAGIIMALVSIPISIGYALVAGLPPVYGLYGSVLPTVIFGLLTTSPRFYFGVDAAPAALVGGILYQMGIAYQSDEALRIIPVITLVTAAWLLLFRLAGVGGFVRFISTPVMGGFITGIGCTIILMQVPKLYGGDSGRGELFELLKHIIETAGEGFNLPSLALGIGTIVLLQVSKRWIPKVPMSAVVMFVGAALSAVFPLKEAGVRMLPNVPAGLPHLIIPDISVMHGSVRLILLNSLTIALVILAETLLSTRNYASKYEDRIDNNQEIIAYAAANLASAMSGCCPVNGSVSRTGIADQFGVRSQMMSLVSGVVMTLILLFATGFIAYLPVPVLTGIVISALMGILEFDLAKSLRKVDRTEWRIFYAVLLTVLLFGTVYGVLIGIVLSFLTVIIRASAPPRDRMGFLPESDSFYPVGRVRGVREIRHAVIYRFSGTLFFANIESLESDLGNVVREDTKALVLDASGITSVDVTAAGRLLDLYRKFRQRGVSMYITGQDSAVNDQLRAFGCEEMFDDGAVRQSIQLALSSAGFRRPYDLLPAEDGEATGEMERKTEASGITANQRAEIEWAYGSDAWEKLEEKAEELAVRFAEEEKFDVDELNRVERSVFGTKWSELDEEQFLDLIEQHAARLEERHRLPAEKLHKMEERLLRHHVQLDAALAGKDPKALEWLVRNRIRREERFREKNPEGYRLFLEERKRHRELLEKEHPELMESIRALRERFERHESNGESHPASDR